MLDPFKNIRLPVSSSRFIVGLPTPNEKYFITIVYDIHNRSNNLILSNMSLYSDPIVIDPLTHITLPVNMKFNGHEDIFIVNNTYAVLFPAYQVGQNRIRRRMLVYEIKDDLHLFCSIDFREFTTDYKGTILSACWYDDHTIAFITDYPLLLYTFELIEKKLTFITKIAEKRDCAKFNSMSLFYISSASKDYFCVLGGTAVCILDNPEKISIWLVEKSLNTVEKKKNALSDYIGDGNINFLFNCSWNVNTANGKCFLLMTSQIELIPMLTSQSHDYVSLFCFDLLYPDTTQKILYEYSIPASYLIPTMIVNEQEDATEVLLFWNTECEVENQSRPPCISVDGYCIVKPSASLKFLWKMCIKTYYTRDEISSTDLPRTLKQYLLA